MHERRSADTDDWELNGDILVYYDVLDIALELSSMGVRVTRDSLIKQLAEQLDRLDTPFHKALAANELPYTIGGAIGQSRLCMYLLDKMHIGEVQASVWDQKTIDECERNNIKLL
ncbi:hypothetical protein JTE90_000155 [Oedothorax gibbosus]|uniref:Aminoacyl-transfer RNA synthetases class-II family profile domain-containing protein n=1 Tax=Oedothorax gibbosus TaxID=931172 RepID=A0AAV6TLH0_9ARAC|nr:hypothetical protein JTE90_000155 [Oedothorax gibbosus]